jgi:hypothetical protein
VDYLKLILTFIYGVHIDIFILVENWKQPKVFENRSIIKLHHICTTEGSVLDTHTPASALSLLNSHSDIHLSPDTMNKQTLGSYLVPSIR